MTLHRRHVVRQLLAERGNTLVVAGLTFVPALALGPIAEALQ